MDRFDARLVLYRNKKVARKKKQRTQLLIERHLDQKSIQP